MMASNHSSNKSDPSQNKSTNVICKYENKELNQKCERIQRGVGSIIAENSELKEAEKVNKETIKSQAETIDALQNDITNVTAENSQLKETNEVLQASIIKLNNTVTSSHILLEKEKSEKQAEISALKSTHIAKETEYQNEINRLMNEVDSLKTNLETSVASNSLLQREISELQQKLLDDAEIESDHEISEQSEEIQNLESEARLMQNHIIEITNEDAPNIIRLPDYTILQRKHGEKICLRLIICDKNDRNLCYEYGYHTTSKRYRCLECKKFRHQVTAKFIKDAGGDDCVELGPNEHSCNPKKFMVQKSNFKIEMVPSYHNSKEYVKRLIVCDPAYGNQNFLYYFHHANKCFFCKECQKQGKYVSATLVKDENGNECIQLSSNEHVCL